MKKFIKAIGAILIGTMILSTTACSSKEEQPKNEPQETTKAENEADKEDTTSQGGELVMSTNAEFPPYEFHSGDKIVGIDIEIAQAVADKMGKTLSIEDMNFDSVIAAVTSGKSDMGVSGITITDDRLLSVDFSEPYFTASQLVIVKAGTEEEFKDLKKPEEVEAKLEGKRIGVQLGTTGDIGATKIKDATVERYNKGFEAVQALIQDKVDAVVIDDQVARALTADTADVVVIETPFTSENYGIAVAKGNEEVLNAANEAIKELKDSGKLDEIFAKYENSEDKIQQGEEENTESLQVEVEGQPNIEVVLPVKE